MLNRTFFKLALCFAPLLSACGEKPAEQPPVDLTQAFLAQTGGKTFRLGNTSFEIDADRSFRLIGDFEVHERIGEDKATDSYGRCLTKIRGNLRVEDVLLSGEQGPRQHIQLEVADVKLLGSSRESGYTSSRDYSAVCESFVGKVKSEKMSSTLMIRSYGAKFIELQRFSLWIDENGIAPTEYYSGHLYATPGSTWSDIVKQDESSIFLVQEGQTIDLTSRVFADIEGAYTVRDGGVVGTATVVKERKEVLVSYPACQQAYRMTFESVYFDNDSLKAKIISSVPLIGYAPVRDSSPDCVGIEPHMARLSGKTVDVRYEVESVRRADEKSRVVFDTPDSYGDGIGLRR